jgi:hypothetical protein
MLRLLKPTMQTGDQIQKLSSHTLPWKPWSVMDTTRVVDAGFVENLRYLRSFGDVGMLEL